MPDAIILKDFRINATLVSVIRVPPEPKSILESQLPHSYSLLLAMIPILALESLGRSPTASNPSKLQNIFKQ